MQDLSRLQRLARWLYLLATATLILIPAVVAVVVISTPPNPETAAALFPDHAAAPGTGVGTLWLALGLACLPGLVFLWVIDRMRRLFGLYAKGDVLSPVAAQHILQIGQGLLACGVLSILTTSAITSLLSLANPPGERVLAVGLSDRDLVLFLSAGLMTVIGWAMREAARVAEDAKGFV